MRRVVGILIAVAALVGAAASQRGIEENRAAEARTAALQSATATQKRVEGALHSYLQGVEARATTAGALTQLRAQLALLRNEGLDGAVGRTLSDWFNNEPEWEPFRREQSVYGVSVDGERLGLVRPKADARLDPAALLSAARDKGSSSAPLLIDGVPYAAAAARVAVPTLKSGAFLLLATPFDEATIKDIAERAGVALLLAGGITPRAEEGGADERARLREAAAHGADAGSYVAANGAWASSPLMLLPGYSLWGLGDSAAAAREAASTAGVTRIIVWAAGVLIALLALFFGLRRPVAVAPAPAGTALGRPSHVDETGASPALIIEGGTPAPFTKDDPRPTSSTEPALGPSGATTSNARRFGRYTLIDRLGEGGMARVYTAVSFGAEGFRRKFVIKRLRPELLDDSAVVAQFIDEANLAASLVHSNIIPVLDFGKAEGEYFQATEYILGRDLGRLTREALAVDRTGLPVDIALFAAAETLKALEYAHTRTDASGQPIGLVHRDVSPNNVLVSSRGEVKLFDFGIVKAQGRVTRTEQGVVKGNVSFMSPEQARGVEVDGRSDLFALGLLLYYCLRGEVLYSGSTNYELLHKAALGPGHDEIGRVRGLPAPANHLVERALAVDPAARFQTAAEFSAALAPHVARGGSGRLTELMTRYFSGEFKQEEARFNSVAFESAATEVLAAEGPRRP